MMPTFIDFEASSLSPNSYPIEVAWNHSDGSIESHLISPADVSEWTDWSAGSQAVHGLTRQELIEHGKSPSWVCRRMKESISHQVLYSDEVQFDEMWLSKLFTASNLNGHGFKIAKVENLVLEIMCPQGADRYRAMSRLVFIRSDARKLVGGQHRAALDVQYSVECWRLAWEYRQQLLGKASA